MNQPLPDSLATESNRPVIAFLDGKSAHSDICEPLSLAIQGLENTEKFSPNWQEYRYFIAHTNSVIFAFATGMSAIHLRLQNEHREALLAQRAYQAEKVGPLWYGFPLFGGFECEQNLKHWAAEAHKYASI